ncbi:phosphatase PAP2 family protein [Variovorax sp. CAN2819]|uniref:phosphatase PAP2 family protein n=1 Tax=Variovorax sp. CAN15 TaxID=3046727 RepID=UPI002649C1DB|nr:phosphatase PAP2 family protein [Variovorax sp. CAN15]MDN6887240.1 phosphatase PAP2 family protein [Variovorax sp. CAN15]
MQALDFALFGLINAGASVPSWSLRFAEFCSDLLPALLILSIGVCALFSRRWRYALFTVLLSVLAAWIAVSLIRTLAPIPRPAFYGLGIQWVPQGVRPGFPSMHAAGTFAAAFSLWCLPSRLPALAALAVATLVAWSRVYLGLHFPSDIVAAIMLGALVAFLVERGASRPLSQAASGALVARRRSARLRLRRTASLNTD